MSSGTQIIQEALQNIGAYSVAAPPQAENIEVGRTTLNSMLQMWLTKGIDLGIMPLDAAGDELSEPLDTRQGIIDNLSIMLAPKFDNGKAVVSQDLKRNAKIGYNDIRKAYQVINIPNKTVSSTMPTGQGNKSGLTRSNFAGEDFVVGD